MIELLLDSGNRKVLKSTDSFISFEHVEVIPDLTSPKEITKQISTLEIALKTDLL